MCSWKLGIIIFFQQNREDAANIHITVADLCYQKLKSMGKQVVMKKDIEVKEEDIKHKDLLISIGIYLVLISGIYDIL